MVAAGSELGDKLPGRILVKRHRGEPGHTQDTRDTRTNLTTIHSNRNPTTQTRTKTARQTQQPQEQPQARSRPLPAADFLPVQ